LLPKPYVVVKDTSYKLGPNYVTSFSFLANVDLQALKNLFTSRSTGISCKGRWLTTEDLEAYLYALSQPGALTGALNYFRNVFRYLCFLFKKSYIKLCPLTGLLVS